MDSNTTHHNSSANSVEDLPSDSVYVTLQDWHVHLVFASLYGALATLTAAGNGLVFVVLCAGRSHRKTPSAGLVMNLAAADTLLAGTLLIHVVLLLDVRLSLDDVVCLVYVLLLSFTSLGVQMSLLLVVADRYVAVRHPLRYTRIVRPANVLGAVVGVWVYTLLVTLLSLHPTFGSHNIERLCLAGDVLDASYVVLLVVHYLVITVLCLVAGLSVTAIACRQHRRVKAAILGVFRPQKAARELRPPAVEVKQQVVRESSPRGGVVPKQAVRESHLRHVEVSQQTVRKSLPCEADVSQQTVKEPCSPVVGISRQTVRDSYFCGLGISQQAVSNSSSCKAGVLLQVRESRPDGEAALHQPEKVSELDQFQKTHVLNVVSRWRMKSKTLSTVHHQYSRSLEQSSTRLVGSGKHASSSYCQQNSDIHAGLESDQIGRRNRGLNQSSSTKEFLAESVFCIQETQIHYQPLETGGEKSSPVSHGNQGPSESFLAKEIPFKDAFDKKQTQRHYHARAPSPLMSSSHSVKTGSDFNFTADSQGQDQYHGRRPGMTACSQTIPSQNNGHNSICPDHQVKPQKSWSGQREGHEVFASACQSKVTRKGTMVSQQDTTEETISTLCDLQTSKCPSNSLDLTDDQQAGQAPNDEQYQTAHSTRTKENGECPAQTEQTSEKKNRHASHFNTHTVQSSVRRTFQFLRRSGLVSLFFTLSWLPYAISELMELAGWPVPALVRRSTVISIFLMPLTNPVIYVWGNTRFRLSFLKLWRRSRMWTRSRTAPLPDGGSATPTAGESYV
ncbi:hypothetical protein BaRGS_00026910 [Batillaria attramentaria]|uniref:G-protein coupled receptors family 1 profile domain-containing protein n=1 Tax=Batillaria attramentaria TaxID=370345 RepID=A0ABD0K3R4_9CAEN